MHEFIPNIDDANVRITHLEKELGLAQSEFIPNIDEANARIKELEARKAALPAGSKSMPVTGRAGLQLTGLRRAIAANGGGVQPRYNAEPSKPGLGLARAIAANQARKQ
jgi:hypothetical protein